MESRTAVDSRISRVHLRLHQLPSAGVQGCRMDGRRLGQQPLCVGRGHQPVAASHQRGLPMWHSRLRRGAGLRGLPQERAGWRKPSVWSRQVGHEGVRAIWLCASLGEWRRTSREVPVLRLPHAGIQFHLVGSSSPPPTRWNTVSPRGQRLSWQRPSANPSTTS